MVQYTSLPEEPAVPITAISLNCPEISESAGKIVKGTSARIYTVLTPSNATSAKLTWISTNHDVITVSQEGIATALAEGVAEIYVTTENGVESPKLRFEVVSGVLPTAIDLDYLPYAENMGRIITGDFVKLDPVLTPANASGANLIWISTNPEVLAFTSSGVATALSAGTAEVYAKASNGVESPKLKFEVFSTEGELTLRRAEILLANDNYLLLRSMDKPHRILTEAGAEKINFELLVTLYHHSADLTSPSELIMPKTDFYEQALYDILLTSQRRASVLYH